MTNNNEPEIKFDEQSVKGASESTDDGVVYDRQTETVAIPTHSREQFDNSGVDSTKKSSESQTYAPANQFAGGTGSAESDEDSSEYDEEDVGGILSILVQRLEVQLGLVLSGLAFFIVWFFGIISGVSFLTMLWRSVVFTLVFFIVGFGIIFILRKIVPDAFPEDDPFTSIFPSRQKNFDATIDDDDDGEAPSEGTSHIPPTSTPETKQGKYADDMLQLDDGNAVPNDPEMMARAIQTVMSRDKDT
jgi:hypothetical protein